MSFINYQKTLISQLNKRPAITFTNGLIIGMFLLVSSLASYGQAKEDSLKATLRYGDKGFEFQTANKNYLMQIQWRLQTRIAAPYDSDPISFEDFGENEVTIGINRARMKVGGHAFKPNFKYYLEYELWASKLLDYRLMYEFSPAFKLRVGQWKARYTRERVISSGKQQTVDRSILNYAFTLDRQQGISLYGRLKGQGLMDFNYWVSAFTGTGRGVNDNDDEHLMWMTRWQWNPWGYTSAVFGL